MATQTINDMAWSMHPPYDGYRCSVCGTQATGSKLHCTWGLLLVRPQDDMKVFEHLRRKLLPCTNFWQHLAVGLMGSREDRDYTFAEFWNEPIRWQSSYFQVCPACREGARTVQSFIDKEERYERHRQEALEILENL